MKEVPGEPQNESYMEWLWFRLVRDSNFAQVGGERLVTGNAQASGVLQSGVLWPGIASRDRGLERVLEQSIAFVPRLIDSGYLALSESPIAGSYQMATLFRPGASEKLLGYPADIESW